MRSISNLLIHPLIQSHWCDSILADTNSLAVSLVSPRPAIYQLEYDSSPGRNVRDCSRSQTFLRRNGDDTLVNLNCCQSRVQRITLGSHSIELLVPFCLGSLEPTLNNLVNLATLELLSFLEFPLVLS